MADIFKKAREILSYKYSWRHESKLRRGKVSVILSDDEAHLIQEAIYNARRLQDLIEFEDELKELETEIERLKKNSKDYVPPLDEYIEGETKRADYLKERIREIRLKLFSKEEPDKGENMTSLIAKIEECIELLAESGNGTKPIVKTKLERILLELKCGELEKELPW